MLKKLHPVFQFVIIGGLFAAFLAISIFFHVHFWVAFWLFIICAAFGASITTHEENVLSYNLEDVEIDTLAKIEQFATAEQKKVLAKLKALAERGRAAERELLHPKDWIK